MIQEQFISVTDLRTQTKKAIQGLRGLPKYILVNNRPVAVLVDIAEYQEFTLTPKLTELKKTQVSKTLKKEAAAAKRLKKSALLNIG